MTYPTAHTLAVENAQYMRRNRLILFGVKEDKGENVKEKILHITNGEKMGLNIQKEDIEAAHRFGSPNKNPNRPIIMRFGLREKKYEVIKMRRALKGSKISFAEDVCDEYRKLMGEVKEHPHVKQSWFTNGKLFAADDSGKKVQVKYGSNWKKDFSKKKVIFGANQYQEYNAENLELPESNDSFTD